MCLALLKYEKPDQSEATELWQNYLDETAAQYRSSVSEMDRTHYLLPLRLQLHILLKYDAAALPAAVTRIFELIDYTEDRIVLAHSLMESSQHLGKPVSNAIRAGVWTLLENGYWPLALRIGHAPVTQSIRQYETMYNAVKVWYQAP